MTADYDDPASPGIPGLAPQVVLSRARAASADDDPGPRRIVLTLTLGAFVVFVLVSILGIIAARTLAERQSLNDSAATADLIAETVVQPALRNGVTSGDPDSVRRMTEALNEYMATSPLVRVKLWSRDGTIIYSDEQRLVGERFTLGEDEQEVFVRPRTVAEVSDLGKPENRFERGQGKLLEAYRPVWTPDGTPLLFETYSPYEEVDQRTSQLWRGFAGVTVSSLLVFIALIAPLLWQLMTRVRAAQHQRELLLQRSVDASTDERQRIAGTLHDGVVQELAGASFAIGGAAARADALGDDDLAHDLREVAGTLRDSLGGLRTLLVDIYPETLATAGLIETLRDLTRTVRSHDIEVHLTFPDVDPKLGPERDRLVFRVVHECFQNARRHSGAKNLWLSMAYDATGVVVEIVDDGVGFDVESVLANPEEGHFGLRVLGDLASRAGADLVVAAAPGAGCTWTLRLP